MRYRSGPQFFPTSSSTIFSVVASPFKLTAVGFTTGARRAGKQGLSWLRQQFRWRAVGSGRSHHHQRHRHHPCHQARAAAVETWSDAGNISKTALSEFSHGWGWAAQGRRCVSRRGRIRLCPQDGGVARTAPRAHTSHARWLYLHVFTQASVNR